MRNPRLRVIAAAGALALALGAAPAATAGGYTETRYPIVLAHGMAGFDELIEVYDYFFMIPASLAAGGAEVHVTQVSAFNSWQVRGEQLLAQVEEIVAATGCGKVNLIGHSQGSLDVRYVAGVRPDLVASVSTIAGLHQGADLADFVRALLEEGSTAEEVLASLANALGMVISALSGGEIYPQDSLAALETLTSAGMEEFNALFPAGLPTAACGEGPVEAGGIRFYSWTGTKIFTNSADPTDLALALTSLVYSEDNDGLAGRCSTHLGDVLNDHYRMNHADEINQVLGLVYWLEVDPKTVFRVHANRLKGLGL